jgi:ribosomal protein S18 acetylase RimI-like enzyme
MTIRLMTPEDYDRVLALWQSTPGVGLNSIDDSRQGIEKYLKRNPTTCFVAEDDSQIVGAIISGHDGRRGFIYHMAVAPNFRRRGIGRTLADAALAALRREGVTKAALVVFKENEGGNRFWEALGFTTRGDLVYRNITIIPQTYTK